MKKILLLLFAVTFITFFFIPVGPSAKAEEAKTFIGTIKSFAYGFGFRSGPPLWPLGMIEVVADNGQKNNFLFVGSGRPRATIFYDIDGRNLGMVTEGLSRTEAAKKVGIGKKVEVTYTTPQETARFIHRNLAISVRYVPADYVAQQTMPGKPVTVSETPANTSETNIFVGKIERSGGALRYWWKFTAVADNGEKKEFRVPRGGATIIQIDGKQRYGEAPRRGRKIEVKYSVTERDDNVTTSMRYVPLDYVRQPTASSVPANVPSETTQLAQESAGQTGNTFTGRVESVKKMLPRPPYWRLALLTVVGDSGEKKNIDIVNDTAVTDAFGKEKGKGRSAWNLENGERVEVNYSPEANSGHNKAVSIHCLY
ncbi:MAG: hypothetical protein PHC54_06735 [Candidatus Omnitrophica bacterium]|nr:hypothetical protein [Candidatus Omnitrophota bacterium]MDD5593064.1 hypothetical protein [Candidatus Omnitrophota bacterium]